MVPKGRGAGGCRGEDAHRNAPCPVRWRSATLLGMKSLTLTRVAPAPDKFGCPINTGAMEQGWCHGCSAGLGGGVSLSSPRMTPFWTQPITHPTEMSQGEPSGVVVPGSRGMHPSQNSLPKSPRSQGYALCRGTPLARSHCKLTSPKLCTGFPLELVGFSPTLTQGWGCTWGISFSAIPWY